MTLDRLLRWVFFCGGIITAIFAGYMFYIDNIAGGAAWLAVAVGFLSFSTRIKQEAPEQESTSQDDSDLHDMAVLIADIAVMSLQNIGRTVPPNTREIEDMEEKLKKFLDVMPVSESERADIAEKFEAVREKARRNATGRAILRSSRL
ncbi:MAG: hypothetical protein IJR85_08880 [Synergistaceae bacterium]|nr:hypothetical protein [Synergistaceae bacterium]